MQNTIQASALRDARSRLRFTQQAVADKSGVSTKTIRRAESGCSIAAENLLSIFAALGLSAESVAVHIIENSSFNSSTLPAEKPKIVDARLDITKIAPLTWNFVCALIVGLMVHDNELVIMTLLYFAIVRYRKPGLQKLQADGASTKKLFLYISVTSVIAIFPLFRAFGNFCHDIYATLVNLYPGSLALEFLTAVARL